LKEDDKSMVQEHFPNVDYVSIPNAGHWVHGDNPAAFLEALNLFLA
jgi:pimeloyl-ACP methyl ester carboxylesterase